jgi:hypothetical protein
MDALETASPLADEQDSPAFIASLDMNSPERRRNDRYPLVKPVKFRCESTGRYVGGKTLNVSITGALVEVGSGSSLTAGDRVCFGIAWSQRNAVLNSDYLVPATVLRSTRDEQGTSVAIQFDRPQRISAAAISAAA